MDKVQEINSNKYIHIKGARVHNLNNININIPLNKLTVVTGPSGSGKTSLIFHTLYAESKRRYLNSFPSYIKFFGDRPQKVDVNEISPVLPTFALPQWNPIVGQRYVVGDLLGLDRTLARFYSLYAIPCCPEHNIPLKKNNIINQLQNVLENKKFNKEDVIHIFVLAKKYRELLQTNIFPTRSFSLHEKQIKQFDENDMYWEILRSYSRNAVEKFEKYYSQKTNLEEIVVYNKTHNKSYQVQLKDEGYICSECSYSVNPVTSWKCFSAQNAIGACSECNGFGKKLVYDEEKLIPDKNITLQEGAIKFLEFSRFSDLKKNLIKVCLKNNINTSLPYKKIQNKVNKFLYKGKQEFNGLNKAFEFIDKRKYKANYRIFKRKYQSEILCDSCQGSRISSEFLNYSIDIDGNLISIDSLLNSNLKRLYETFSNIGHIVNKEQKGIQDLVGNICEILKQATLLGLEHLKYLRALKTLSSGEYQRLLAIKYLTFKGTNCLFIFDEPTLGLSIDEQKAFMKNLLQLKNQGNTVIIIDHSDYFKFNCDRLVLLGPGPGAAGGNIVFDGDSKSFKRKFSQYHMVKEKNIKSVKFKNLIKVKGAKGNGLGPLNYEIPLNKLTWVTGKSGTGKTTLVTNLLNQYFSGVGNTSISYDSVDINGSSFESIHIYRPGLNKISNRSTVGTFTGLSPLVRKYYSNTPMAKLLGLKEGHFSVNSQLGQCPECEGKGHKTIDMLYMEDVEIECDFCHGLKLRPEYANITDGKMTVTQALNNPLIDIIPNLPRTGKLERIMGHLKLLNLSYLTLNRPLSSLSGGEKQRIQLLSGLQKELKNSIIFIENISFGLANEDLIKVLEFLQCLKEKNNTIVLIDQSPLISHFADYKLLFLHQ